MPRWPRIPKHAGHNHCLVASILNTTSNIFNMDRQMVITVHIQLSLCNHKYTPKCYPLDIQFMSVRHPRNIIKVTQQFSIIPIHNIITLSTKRLPMEYRDSLASSTYPSFPFLLVVTYKVSILEGHIPIGSHQMGNMVARVQSRFSLLEQVVCQLRYLMMGTPPL